MKQISRRRRLLRGCWDFFTGEGESKDRTLFLLVNLPRSLQQFIHNSNGRSKSGRERDGWTNIATNFRIFRKVRASSGTINRCHVTTAQLRTMSSTCIDRIDRRLLVVLTVLLFPVAITDLQGPAVDRKYLGSGQEYSHERSCSRQLNEKAIY